MESIVHHADCMEIMAQYPYKHFDLAVVDPPYGIDVNMNMGRRKGMGTKHKNKNWDNESPNQYYFNELARISNNQIIWGGNYFALPPSRCFIIWDKKTQEELSFSMCEFAWTSFDKVAKIFRKTIQTDNNNRIHPTQKPVALYDWIYKNYLPEGGKVIDTHLGSGSNRIAADKAGNINFVGCELDRDYFDAQEKRWSNYKAQLTIQF
jgi:site-specific DNA-methyltransferase (adenine-specific)